MSKKTISGQTSSNRTAVGFAIILAAACGVGKGLA